jgi:protein-disulfide isomerase
VLVVVHLWVQAQAGFAFGCTGAGDAASGAGCAEVTTSIYSDFLGVSLLVWGGAFYLLLAALRVGVAALEPPTSDTLRTASLALVSVGFLFVLYLLGVQAFVLGQFCTLCLLSSATTTVLFALHLVERAKGPGPAVAASVALRPYAIAAVALIVLAGADVLLADTSPAPAPVAQGQNADGSVQAALTAGGVSAGCRYDVEVARFRDFDRLLTMETPYHGSADAPVNVMKIFDPNCPHCNTLHQILEPAIAQLGDEARFYYKPYPIWDYSVPQVQALYLAGEEGKFFEMLELQFANQQRGGLSLDQIVALAERIGMDGERVRREIENRKYVGLIRQQNELIQETGLRSVPKVAIEGRVIVSTDEAFTTDCLGALIDLAAREKGAVEESPSAADVAQPTSDS